MKFTKEVADKYVSTFFIVKLFDSKLKKIQAVFKAFILSPWLFINIFVIMETKKEFNCRHCMLDFPIFVAVP